MTIEATVISCRIATGFIQQDLEAQGCLSTIYRKHSNYLSGVSFVAAWFQEEEQMWYHFGTMGYLHFQVHAVPFSRHSGKQLVVYFWYHGLGWQTQESAQEEALVWTFTLFANWSVILLAGRQGRKPRRKRGSKLERTGCILLAVSCACVWCACLLWSLRFRRRRTIRKHTPSLAAREVCGPQQWEVHDIAWSFPVALVTMKQSCHNSGATTRAVHLGKASQKRQSSQGWQESWGSWNAYLNL